MSLAHHALELVAAAPSVAVPALGPDWLNPEVLLTKFGDLAFWAAVGIVFAECGLLIGFFLPGDSLLFVVGLLIASGYISMPLPAAIVILSVAAVVGNLCGYWIGTKFGPALFNKPDSKLFKQEYVDHTHAFFEKYGNRAIVLARFTPIVRTFITAMAGVAGMSFKRFAIYSTIGGVVWVTAFTLLGYFLGNVPIIKNNIETMALAIVVISVLPIAYEYWKNKRESATRDATEGTN